MEMSSKIIKSNTKKTIPAIESEKEPHQGKTDLSFEDNLYLLNIIDKEAVLSLGRDGLILEWSNGASRLFGYTRDEARGMHVQMLMPEHLRERYNEDLYIFLEHQTPPGACKNIEFRALHKSGHEFPVEISLSSKEDRGKVLVSAMIRDISERMHSDETLHYLIAGTVGRSGSDFFETAARGISTWLGAQCVIMGRLFDDGSVRSLEMLRDGKRIYDYSYNLSGSPCDRASRKGFCFYPKGVTRLYPEDKHLEEMKAEGYAGAPIKNTEGKTIGIICAISANEMVLPARGREVFDIFAAKAASEIESKEAKDKLKESEEKFKTLVQSISGYLYSIIYCNEDVLLTYHSPQCSMITGYSPEDYSRDPNLWINMVHEEDRSKVALFFNDLKNHGKTKKIEHRIVHKKGHTVWVLNQCTVTLDQGGDVERADGLVLDITDQKKAEHALRESEQNFRNIFNNTVDGILITGIESQKFRMVNEMFCRMVGFSEEELKRMSIADIHPEESIPHVTEQFERLVRGEIRVAENIPVKRKDGSIFYADINSSVYMLESEECVIGLFRDNTERKKAEELIRQTLSERNTILETVLLGISFIRKNRFEWVNKEMSNLFGYTKDEYLANGMGMLFNSPDEIEQFINVSGPLLSAGRPFDTERKMRRKDGGILWCRIMGRSIDSSNSSKGSIWIMEDITEHKKGDEAILRAKEKAEEATKLKDKFVSLVSHDLKGPLTRILGYLQLLRDGSFDHDTQNSFFSEAIESCDEMGSLISEILDISKIKSGMIKPKFSFIDANHIAEYALKNYELMAKAKGIDLINNIPKGTRIYADERLYFEAIRNLISNAVKFCHKGDTITIYCPDGYPTSIAVSDTGIGIKASRLDTIFIYEEKSSTKGTSGESGTGFGLPLARDIMEAQGGALHVQSIEGEGSTFYAELPLVKPNILIVDDEQLILDMLRKTLETTDSEIVEATSVCIALAKIELHKPHLILLDILMPEESGFVLLKNLKKNAETKDIPVIIVTGDPNEESHNVAFEYGAADFVMKPFRIEDIIPRVRRFIK